MKSFVRFNRIKKPLKWAIISKTMVLENKFLLFFKKSKELGFFYEHHLRILRLYIRKVLKKRFRKPLFLFRPYLFLTKKGKATRMGKGKGTIADKFFPTQFGHCLIHFPVFESFLLSRLFRSLKLRLPFRTFILDMTK